LEVHATGAVWLDGLRTVLLADVHLGYGWALRRRGQLGPVEDTNTWPKLESLINELEPEHIVILGDVVHAPRPAPGERELVEQVLGTLAARAELTLVLGNHDRGFVRDFPDLPVRVCQTWATDGILAVHGDRPAAVAERGLTLLGHYHPALGVVDDAGASQRIPVFLSSEKGLVLPAFSPFAAGYDVKKPLPREIRETLGSGIEVFAATGKRIVALGELKRLRGTGPNDGGRYRFQAPGG
jgi:uncharacterized protein